MFPGQRLVVQRKRKTGAKGIAAERGRLYAKVAARDLGDFGSVVGWSQRLELGRVALPENQSLHLTIASVTARAKRKSTSRASHDRR